MYCGNRFEMRWYIMFYFSFFSTLSVNAKVKELSKLHHIHESYSKNKNGTFLWTTMYMCMHVCIVCHVHNNTNKNNELIISFNKKVNTTSLSYAYMHEVILIEYLNLNCLVYLLVQIYYVTYMLQKVAKRTYYLFSQI